MDIVNLEERYFSLKTSTQETLNQSEEVVVTHTSNANNPKNEISQEGNTPLTETNSSTIIHRVPDSVFKVGTFDKWYHVHNTSSSAPYAYSRISHNFAGTGNRLTYIIFFDIPKTNNFSTQNFSLQIGVRDNTSVIYNVYDGRLLFFGEENRLKANNVYLKHKSNTSNGIFWARKYAGLKNSSVIGNISRAVLTWVPYVGSAVSSYDHLTASTATKTGTLYTWHSTPEAQRRAHKDGYINSEVEIRDSGPLRYKNNYLLLETRGNGIRSINWAYGYSVTK